MAYCASMHHACSAGIASLDVCLERCLFYSSLANKKHQHMVHMPYAAKCRRTPQWARPWLDPRVLLLMLRYIDDPNVLCNPPHHYSTTRPIMMDRHVLVVDANVKLEVQQQNSKNVHVNELDRD